MSEQVLSYSDTADILATTRHGVRVLAGRGFLRRAPDCEDCVTAQSLRNYLNTRIDRAEAQLDKWERAIERYNDRMEELS